MSPANKNLLLRVGSAAVLLPIVLYLVWLGGWSFAILVAVIAALCAWEMVGMVLRPCPLPFRLTIVGASVAVPLYFGLEQSPSGQVVLAGLVSLLILFWLASLLAPGEDLQAVPGRVALAMTTVLYTGGLLATAVLLRQLEAGAWWLVLVLAITFLADTGAYFAGRAFGRRKLYPRVSPNKTWEGFFGGLLAGMIGAVGVVLVSRTLGQVGLPMGLVMAAGLGVVVAAFASAGDLCESLLKRAFMVKDSGSLIPGHGGMLDRVDALLFTGPLVWLWAVLLG